MLSLLNTFLIVIIILVIFVNILATQRRIENIQTSIKPYANLDKKLLEQENKFNQKVGDLQKSISSRNLLDLAEFDKLDKDFKKNYQTYIVNDAMPRAMEQVNKYIQDNNMSRLFQDNKDTINNAIDAYNPNAIATAFQGQ